MATISQININGIDYDVKDKRLKTEREKQNIIIDPFKDGESTYGNKSVSIGHDNVAEGEGSVALGIGTKATGNYQTVIGKYNSDDTQSTFIIGNGTDDDNRSSLFNVNQDGKVITRGPANQLTGASFVTVLNNMNDSREVDVSANRWGDGLCIADNTETVRSYLRHNDITDGQGLQLETRRYDTDAKNHFVYNGIRLLIKKDGTPVVGVSYPATWRNALGLDTASNIITNTGGVASWRTGLGLRDLQATTYSGGVKTLTVNTWTNIVSATLAAGSYLVFSQIGVPGLTLVKQSATLTNGIQGLTEACNKVKSTTTLAQLRALLGDSGDDGYMYAIREYTKACGGGVFHSEINIAGEADGTAVHKVATPRVDYGYNSTTGVLVGVREVAFSTATTIQLRAWQNYRNDLTSTSSNVVSGRLLVIKRTPY